MALSLSAPRTHGCGCPRADPRPLAPAGTDLNGKSIRAAAFRSRFHAAVVAIKRNGIPLNWTGPHIGDEVLQASAWLLGAGMPCLLGLVATGQHLWVKPAPSPSWHAILL